MSLTHPNLQAPLTSISFPPSTLIPPALAISARQSPLASLSLVPESDSSRSAHNTHPSNYAARHGRKVSRLNGGVVVLVYCNSWRIYDLIARREHVLAHLQSHRASPARWIGDLERFLRDRCWRVRSRRQLEGCRISFCFMGDILMMGWGDCELRFSGEIGEDGIWSMSRFKHKKSKRKIAWSPHHQQS